MLGFAAIGLSAELAAEIFDGAGGSLRCDTSASVLVAFAF
jgi:hypothetical protein